MNFRNIVAIIKKELRSFFDSPTAYIVLLVFLLLWQFLFFRDAFIIAEASLRNLVAYLPWLFLILIPALTMGSFANEKNEGTLEFLLTHPLKAFELILGKFWSTILFVAGTLAFMFPIAFSFSQFGPLDWGVVLGQYLAGLLLAAMFISLGLFISSLLANQISALLVSVAGSFLFIIIGLELITLSVPTAVANLFDRLSALSHFLSMSRGVIDLRDLWYFLSATIIFLALTYLQLLKWRIGNQKTAYQRYVVGISLFIGITLLLNVLGDRLPGRIDLTEDKAYQLSQTTKEILIGLDDVVNIRLYASADLPTQLRPILRDTQDILRDYGLYSNGKVRLEIKDPMKDEQISREAAELGIREVQFNVIGQEELQLRRGYFGIAILYGGKNEVIPIVNTATDLEYQLTSLIRKLTVDDKKTVAFLDGFGQKDYQTDYGILTQELSKSYQVESLDITSEETNLDENVDVLVIAGPTELIEEEYRKKIADYYLRGGSVFMMVDGAIVNQQDLTARTNDNSLADFLPSFGIELGQDIVFDIRSNQPLNFTTPDGQGFVSPYPFWPRVEADPETNTTLTKQIRTLVLPWPSSLKINQDVVAEQDLRADVLFKTTNFGGSQVGNFDILPEQNSVPTQLEPKTVALSLVGNQSQENERFPRMIIVGTSNFLINDVVVNTFENIAFGLEAIAWLAQDQSLAEIQLKQRQTRQLLFEDPNHISLVRYGNMGLALILPIVIGVVRLVRRNNLKQLNYEKN